MMRLRMWAALALVVATNAVVLAGVAYNRSGEPEATVTGVAWLAARAAGIVLDDQVLRARVAVARTYAPRLGDAERFERQAQFRAAVELVRQGAR